MKLDLGSAVSVLIEAGEEKPCSYTVLEGGEAVVSYETSADVRSQAGLIGLRNVVSRRIEGLEKERVESRLAAELDRRADAVDDALGPR